MKAVDQVQCGLTGPREARREALECLALLVDEGVHQEGAVHDAMTMVLPEVLMEVAQCSNMQMTKCALRLVIALCKAIGDRGEGRGIHEMLPPVFESVLALLAGLREGSSVEDGESDSVRRWELRMASVDALQCALQAAGRAGVRFKSKRLECGMVELTQMMETKDMPGQKLKPSQQQRRSRLGGRALECVGYLFEGAGRAGVAKWAVRALQSLVEGLVDGGRAGDEVREGALKAMEHCVEALGQDFGSFLPIVSARMECRTGHLMR